MMSGPGIDALGFLAGFFTSVSLLPQLLKMIRTGEVRDVSLFMYIILATGISLWIVYGFMIGAFPVIVANLISLVFCCLILFNKLTKEG